MYDAYKGDKRSNVYDFRKNKWRVSKKPSLEEEQVHETAKNHGYVLRREKRLKQVEFYVLLRVTPLTIGE